MNINYKQLKIILALRVKKHDSTLLVSILNKFSLFDNFFSNLAKFWDLDNFSLFEFLDLNNFSDFLASFSSLLSNPITT